MSMEVILKKDVYKIGNAGDVVKVKDGFAHNYLFANGLAMPFNAANLKKLEEEKQKKNAQLEKLKSHAIELKSKLDNLSLTMPVLVQGEDKLYGSIGQQEIAAALKDEGLEVGKESIMITEPIKILGIYEIPIKLHPEVSAKLKIWIVKK